MREEPKGIFWVLVAILDERRTVGMVDVWRGSQMSRDVTVVNEHLVFAGGILSPPSSRFISLAGAEVGSEETLTSHMGGGAQPLC